MTLTELAAWLNAEIQYLEDRQTAYAQCKRPMRLTRGQEIELHTLRRVRTKLETEN